MEVNIDIECKIILFYDEWVIKFFMKVLKFIIKKFRFIDKSIIELVVSFFMFEVWIG